MYLFGPSIPLAGRALRGSGPTAPCLHALQAAAQRLQFLRSDFPIHFCRLSFSMRLRRGSALAFEIAVEVLVQADGFEIHQPNAVISGVAQQIKLP